MSEYHYVRTLGEEGGVDRCDGQAIGIDLESVLEDGLPPWKVTLEIIAALCEILDIANEDDAVHGDVDPEYIFVDETGAVSLEGYGSGIDRSRAPEGQPRGERTDRYGLGYTAYRLMCGAPFPELPDDDPDAHDDGVIDAVLQIDLSGLPEEMQGDIQWFVAKLMSFDREERPSPVDAWRTFIAFSDGTEGPGMPEWCNLALDGEGERRGAGLPATSAEATPPEAASPEAAPIEAAGEDALEGPVKEAGPLGEGGMNFESGATPGAGATAFWDKDQMKAALDAGEEEEARPAMGGGSATNFWSKEDLDAMRGDTEAAPKPKRAEGEGARRQATMIFSRKSRKDGTATGATEVPKAAAPPAAPAPPTPTAAPPPAPVEPPEPVEPPTPVAAPEPPAPSPEPLPVIEGPSVPSAPQGPPSVEMPAVDLLGFEEEEAKSGPGMGMIIGALAAVMLLLVCAGIAGGGLWYASSEGLLTSGAEEVSDAVADVEEAPEEEAVEATPDEEVEEVEEVEKVEEARPTRRPRPAAAPSPSPVPRAQPSRSRPAPAPAAAPAPAGAPEPAPAAAPAAPTGPARVTFRSSGRGSVTCSDKKTNFDGRATLRFEAYELPATCLVSIDDGRGVFQVYGRGEVTCNLSGGIVECDPGAVR